MISLCGTRPTVRIGCLLAVLLALPVSECTEPPITITVDAKKVIAKTSRRLTGVDIDVCALKQGLNFSNPLLVALAKHLAPTVLRIGGTDQNSFTYDMKSKAFLPACKCKKSCVMTGAYWSTVQKFVADTGLELIFGLNPESSANAKSLIYHSAHQNFTGMLAYSFGNEQTGDDKLADAYLEKMTAVREALFAAYPAESGPVSQRPLLIGADTGIGPRHLGYTPSNASEDKSIEDHLKWVETFVKKCAPVLDAVTWHTYDYRAQELGVADHHPLPFPPSSAMSRFLDPSFHDFAGTLLDNITRIVASASPKLAKNVWLTETNSICHQGTYNITNAFFNSLWMVDRVGMMAERGLQLMGRQSLIGYNYSLLGNFPAEPIFAAPDYYTTVLFRRLTADDVLGVQSNGPTNLRIYSFCSAEHDGGVALVLINLDQSQTAPASISLPGQWEEYALAPAWSGDDSASPLSRATSRHIKLNGQLLSIGEQGELPDMSPKRHTSAPNLVVPPLQFSFAVFPDAQAPACSKETLISSNAYV